MLQLSKCLAEWTSLHHVRSLTSPHLTREETSWGDVHCLYHGTTELLCAWFLYLTKKTSLMLSYPKTTFCFYYCGKEEKRERAGKYLTG